MRIAGLSTSCKRCSPSRASTRGLAVAALRVLSTRPHGPMWLFTRKSRHCCVNRMVQGFDKLFKNSTAGRSKILGRCCWRDDGGGITADLAYSLHCVMHSNVWREIVVSNEFCVRNRTSKRDTLTTLLVLAPPRRHRQVRCRRAIQIDQQPESRTRAMVQTALTLPFFPFTSADKS